MSDNNPPSTESASRETTPPPRPPDKDSSTGMIFAGFFSVGGMVLLAMFDKSGTLLMVDLFGIPIIAVILALVPETRKFGLGALLGWGLGALILLAICGRGLSHL